MTSPGQSGDVRSFAIRALLRGERSLPTLPRTPPQVTSRTVGSSLDPQAAATLQNAMSPRELDRMRLEHLRRIRDRYDADQRVYTDDCAGSGREDERGESRGDTGDPSLSLKRDHTEAGEDGRKRTGSSRKKLRMDRSEGDTRPSSAFRPTSSASLSSSSSSSSSSASSSSSSSSSMRPSSMGQTSRETDRSAHSRSGGRGGADGGRGPVGIHSPARKGHSGKRAHVKGKRSTGLTSSPLMTTKMTSAQLSSDDPFPSSTAGASSHRRFGAGRKGRPQYDGSGDDGGSASSSSLSRRSHRAGSGSGDGRGGSHRRAAISTKTAGSGRGALGKGRGGGRGKGRGKGRGRGRGKGYGKGRGKGRGKAARGGYDAPSSYAGGGRTASRRRGSSLSSGSDLERVLYSNDGVDLDTDLDTLLRYDTLEQRRPIVFAFRRVTEASRHRNYTFMGSVYSKRLFPHWSDPSRKRVNIDFLCRRREAREAAAAAGVPFGPGHGRESGPFLRRCARSTRGLRSNARPLSESSSSEGEDEILSGGFED